jgi:hypothetical protein
MYLSSSTASQWNLKRTGQVAIIQSIISFLTEISQMHSDQFICSFVLDVKADGLALSPPILEDQFHPFYCGVLEYLQDNRSSRFAGPTCQDITPQRLYDGLTIIAEIVLSPNPSCFFFPACCHGYGY